MESDARNRPTYFLLGMLRCWQLRRREPGRVAPPRPGGGCAMTEFQLLMLRRLGGAPRHVAGLWLWPEDVRRDPVLAERAYRAVAREATRGLYDLVVRAPLGARGRRGTRVDWM